MNFTREPIIETIITPKEGSKLLLRNSKKESRDDYLVDAIEVVSFGHSIFYRSLERPKSFIVPVSDYEVFEVKETRLALKSASIERSIKIGGGKTPQRPLDDSSSEIETAKEGKTEKRDKKKRSRRRRGGGGDLKEEPLQVVEMEEEIETPKSEGADVTVVPSLEDKKRMSRLLPPPPTLIAQTLGKYLEAIHSDAETLPELAPSAVEEMVEPRKKPTKKRSKPIPAKKERPAAATESELTEEEVSFIEDEKELSSKEKSVEEPKPEDKPKEDKTSFWGLFS